MKEIIILNLVRIGMFIIEIIFFVKILYWDVIFFEMEVISFVCILFVIWVYLLFFRNVCISNKKLWGLILK